MRKHRVKTKYQQWKRSLDQLEVKYNKYRNLDDPARYINNHGILVKLDERKYRMSKVMMDLIMRKK